MTNSPTNKKIIDNMLDDYCHPKKVPASMRNSAYSAYAGGADRQLAVRIAILEHESITKDFKKVYKNMGKEEYSWDTYTKEEKAEYMQAIEHYESLL